MRAKTLDKIGSLTPHGAFRVGMLWSERQMWMHVADIRKREGKHELCAMAVKIARKANRSMLDELSLGRYLKRSAA